MENGSLFECGLTLFFIHPFRKRRDDGIERRRPNPEVNRFDTHVASGRFLVDSCMSTRLTRGWGKVKQREEEVLTTR